MHRSATVVLLLSGALGLGACGGASGTAASTAVSTAPATAPSDQAGAASSAPVAGTSAAAGGGAVSAKDVCAFFESEAPTLESVGSEVGALARLTGDLFTWAEKSGFSLQDARELDTLTQQACPDAGARVLKAIGSPNFDAAF